MMGAGVTDWGMLVATGEEGILEAGLAGSTGWEDAGPHPHDQRSPISYAAAITTPLLIVHGQADTNVPVNQAETLHRALRLHNTNHELVIYPREGHRFREREHIHDLLHRTRSWLQQHLPTSQTG